MMHRVACAVLFATVWHGASQAASFDCAKARTTHEKHICGSPELNAADTRLGVVYKAAVQAFPIRGFVQASQSRFLKSYRSCDHEDERSCAVVLAERTATLQSMISPTAVYSDVRPGGTYDPDQSVLWLAASGNDVVLHYFGSFMPDMISQEPFPDGFVCDDEMPLRATGAGYRSIEGNDEVSVTENKLVAAIFCSARTGIHGAYPRIR